MTVTVTPPPQALVVDDDQQVRLLVRAALEIEGWEVFEAVSGAEALELLRWPPFPNVVLLDVLMPEPDGIEVLRALKAAPITQHVPVVMLSAQTNPLTLRLAQELGAQGYITKPFDIKDLVAFCSSCADTSSASA